MLKRRWHQSLVWVAIMASLLVAACGGGQTPADSSGQGGSASADQQVPPAATEPVTLKVADSFPAGHWMPTRGTQPWMKRVEELTGGQVKFEYYPSEQLGKLSDMLNLLKSGVTDIAYLAPSSLGGDLPLNGVGFLPGAFITSAEGSAAYAQLLAEGPVLEEYRKHGVRPLFGILLPSYEIVSVEDPVGQLSDLKGLKIRTSGSTQDLVITALGGVPVSIPTPEVYTALQRGTVDAAVFPYASVKDYKVDEVIKHATFGAGVTSFAVVYAISDASWNKLSAEAQQALQQAADEVIPEVIRSLDEDTQRLADEFEAQGIQVYRLSDEEKARWQEAMAPVWDRWVEDMEAKGLPGRQVREAFEKALGRE